MPERFLLPVFCCFGLICAGCPSSATGQTGRSAPDWTVSKSYPIRQSTVTKASVELRIIECDVASADRYLKYVEKSGQPATVYANLTYLIDAEAMYDEAMKGINRGAPQMVGKIHQIVDEEYKKQAKKMREAGVPATTIEELEPAARRILERNLIAKEYARSRDIKLVIDGPAPNDRSIIMEHKLVAALLKLAEADERTSVIQAPKITVYNGQRGGIASGTRTDSGKPGENCRCDVLPVVDPERKSVRLSLKLEYKVTGEASEFVLQAGTFEVPVGCALVWPITSEGTRRVLVVATPRPVMIEQPPLP